LGIALPQTSSTYFDTDHAQAAAITLNAKAGSKVLLVCEHASNHIPDRYNGLGLSEVDKASHAAWDPGAQAVSEHLSEMLDATLVMSTVSRLVYDCNRPPSSNGAMPAKSEKVIISGNKAISVSEKEERIKTVYEPFQASVSDAINLYPQAPFLITIHSFTRVYNDQERDVDIGLIHDQDDTLAITMATLSTELSNYRFALNEPYSKADGVAHTLEEHGTSNALVNVMIEVCNDLIGTQEQQREVARMLADLIRHSLGKMGHDMYLEPSG
jgi:predicted N-formylglutamate amidohydrolase